MYPDKFFFQEKTTYITWSVVLMDPTVQYGRRPLPSSKLLFSVGSNGRVTLQLERDAQPAEINHRIQSADYACDDQVSGNSVVLYRPITF